CASEAPRDDRGTASRQRRTSELASLRCVGYRGFRRSFARPASSEFGYSRISRFSTMRASAFLSASQSTRPWRYSPVAASGLFGYLVVTSWYTESAACVFPSPLYVSP